MRCVDEHVSRTRRGDKYVTVMIDLTPDPDTARRGRPRVLDRPTASNGPPEATNGRLEHLRGSALGFRNLTYSARSLLETGGFGQLLHPSNVMSPIFLCDRSHLLIR